MVKEMKVLKGCLKKIVNIKIMIKLIYLFISDIIRVIHEWLKPKTLDK
jgi:hypothetical protein